MTFYKELTRDEICFLLVKEMLPSLNEDSPQFKATVEMTKLHEDSTLLDFANSMSS